MVNNESRRSSSRSGLSPFDRASGYSGTYLPPLSNSNHPYSGGSSLEGNFSAPYGGISVDFAYMDQIVQFNKDDMDIVVQPSIGWQDLNERLATMGSGLFFPIDPGMYSV